MNNTRMKAIEESLNGTARKVLAVLPLREAWTAQQVAQEIARTRAPMERRFIDGCIRLIVEHGLAREVRPGYFQRTPPKPEPQKMIEPQKPSPPAAAAQPKSSDPLQQLSNIATALREHAQRQALLFNALADQMDEAALAMDKQAEAGKKLKALLQEIG